MQSKQSQYKTILVSILLLFLLATNPAGKAEPLFRSSSLQERITKVDDNQKRIDYVNEEGIITDAADKHYATIIQTKNEHTILEEYYDSHGVAAKQSSGYYAVLREYNDNGQEYKTTFLNADKQPMMISSGYAIIIHTYNNNGRAEKDLYYDADLNPIQSKYNGYGSYKGYDEKGRNTLIIHLDRKGNPMIAGNGYAMIKRVFYETGLSIGRVKEEYYYDENENPVCLSLGQYGLYKEYDEYGRNCLLTYLNADGIPIITKKGYTTIKRTFYEDDTIEKEMYYDQTGNPVSLSNGQYGIQKKDGKTYYLDKNSTQYFDLQRVLTNNQSVVIVFILVVLCASFLSGRTINIAILIIYVGCILYMTMTNRSDVRTGIIIEPFWSYRYFFTDAELRWEIVNNILLFIPLGFILYRINPTRKTLLISFALSIIIEILQFALKVGLCETDDIISNGTGSIIGYYICHVLSSRQNRKHMISKMLREE